MSVVPAAEAPLVDILVVDDVVENLVAMRALLARPGVRVLTARSGNEALELLLVHEVALALLDVQMPGMDGFALAELMRGAERTRAVPIIFVTAAPSEPRARSAATRPARSTSSTSRSTRASSRARSGCSSNCSASAASSAAATPSCGRRSISTPP